MAMVIMAAPLPVPQKSKVVYETHNEGEHGGEQESPPLPVSQALLLIRYLGIEIIEEL
jgi:hypothetical protein